MPNATECPSKAWSPALPSASLFYTHRPLTMNTAHEVEQLKEAIKKHGSVNGDGNHSVAYGVLFKETADILEALNGTLRAAKRQKKVTFDGELLMMPGSKDVQVVLLEA